MTLSSKKSKSTSSSSNSTFSSSNSSTSSSSDSSVSDQSSGSDSINHEKVTESSGNDEHEHEGKNSDADDDVEFSSSAVSLMDESNTATSAKQTPHHPQAQAQTQLIQAPVMLSKSWSIGSTRVPMYTGGKFAVLQPQCQDSSTTTTTTTTACLLLLPVGGDVAVVHSGTGTIFRHLRRRIRGAANGRDSVLRNDSDKKDHEEDDEEDEERGPDPNSITAFGCSRSTIVTCSRNSILRQYSWDVEVSTGVAVDDHSATLADGFNRVHAIGKSGHSLPVTTIEFHADGVFFATGSLDGTVRVWDVRGGFCTHVFRPSRPSFPGGVGRKDSGGEFGVRLGVSCIAWKPPPALHQTAIKNSEEWRLAIGREDGSVVVQDLMQPLDAPPVAVLQDHNSTVTCISWIQQNQEWMLLSAGRDSVINLWMKGQAIHTLPVYEQIEGMVVIEDIESIVIATAGSKGVVRKWRISAAMRIEPDMVQVNGAIGADQGGYTVLHSYPGANTSQLVAAGADHQLVFLDSESLQRNGSLIGHLDDILDLRIISSTNGFSSRVALATNSPEIRLLNVNTGDNDSLSPMPLSTTIFSGHTGTVLCLDVSPCKQFLISCGKDRIVRVWNIAHQCCVAKAEGHMEAVGAVAFSQKLIYYRQPTELLAFAVSVSVDRTLKKWSLPRSVLITAKDTHANTVSLVATTTVRAHEKDINMVAVAPNDSLIATASQDKTVRLWSSVDLILKATLKGHKRGVWDAQFSSVDRVLATASGDKTLKLWSLSDYSCVRTFQGHLSSVLRVRFLSCGLQLVSSGADGLIKLWTIRTNECEATLDGHVNKIWALDVCDTPPNFEFVRRSPAFMVSGGGDSRLVTWIDTTAQEAQAKQVEQQENLLLDQKLANHLRLKEYREALAIALRRDKPLHVLKVLTAIIETDLVKGNNGVPSIQSFVRTWSDDQLLQILRYCREWNTRARNCHVAMIVTKAIVSTIKLSKLVTIHGVPEILAGILVYSERHFDRLERLRTDSYLLDFALSNLGSLEAEDDDEQKFTEWEKNRLSSDLVLPPMHVDGRTQVGGAVVVGGLIAPTTANHRMQRIYGVDVSSDESVVTIDADMEDSSSEDIGSP